MCGNYGLAQTPNIDKLETLNPESIPEIPVYRPTVAEFEDFSKCISLIESMGAHHVGLCKIIPPSSWVGRRKGYDDIGDFVVEKPICQSTYGGRGIYFQDISPRKSLRFNDFKNLALSNLYSTPKYRDYNHLERKYWSSIGTSRPLYGANINGTLMDNDQHIWNISKLDSILSQVFREEGVQIPGVNTPYLYYGMWRSTFAWHVEDVDLYSINYLHYGLPKCWYVIPPAFARKFEAFVSEYFRSEFLKCHCFLRHKCVLISPTVLSQSGIPTKKILQHEGEFMITFPYAYHSGFNMGLNIAESTNFALTRWIDYGKHAKICTCWDDTVKICMDPFVKRFQPELFNKWKNDKNLPPHPLDEYLIKETDHRLQNTLAYSGSAENILDAESYEITAKGSLHVQTSSSDSLLPKIGDINLIDMRYSIEQLEKAKIPFYIATNPHLNPLWCGNLANDQTERDFNIFIGSHKPYCAVCSFLWTPQHLSKLLSSGHSEEKLPAYSEPHIPEVAYHSPYDSSVQFPPIVKSRVLKCFRCCLTVHARCYGVQDELVFNFGSLSKESPNHNFENSWCCDACAASSKPTCVFCYMRGGAMKALANINNTFTGRPYWAHLVCALITPGCYFKDVPKRLAFISEDTIQAALSSALLFSEEKEKNILHKMRGSTLTNPFYKNFPLLNPPSYIQKDLKLIRKRPSNSNRIILREYYLSNQGNKVCQPNKSNNHKSRKLSYTTPTGSTLKRINRFNQYDNKPIFDGAHHSNNIKIPVRTRKKIVSPFFSKCNVCRLPGRGFLPLASCWYNGCSSQFHVTCAQMAGIVIGTDVYPRFFYIACKKHPTNYDHPNFHDHGSVSPGDEVMVQETVNPIFSSAIAIRRVTPLYCRISFPDGTFSSDTPPEYLTNINWFKDGPPKKGSFVKVLWDDGVEYAGTYEGTTSEQWEIQLESGEIKVFNREQFYVQPKTKYSALNLAFGASTSDCP
ncbi:putative lysine-specific demethylase 4B [Schistosoma japonicum]|uniref:Putative lysine-specific demethylase 4B n=1 Tax=Schistosoma japonicum TaxID=6182 RepID=A0A4Z2DVL0_SCHJA|nr:Lysine-specific demethylase 4C [Schistosoma japonicum]TNN20388.1 putative lysine-specific demethylase 4B [Schistosoma japonicum]